MQKVKPFFAFLVVFFLLLASGAIATRAQVSAPAWQPSTNYYQGDLVTYSGTVYRCIQTHQSQLGWEPPNVPALWGVYSGGATNTPAPTATKTRTPTATNTNLPGVTPTRTNTATVTKTNTPTNTTNGTCAAPVWSSTAVYVANDVVSYNGHQWRAKWWTQNETPGTTGQYGVWEDQGVCGTVSTATRTPTSTNTLVPTFQPPSVTPTNGPSATPSRTPSPFPTSSVGLPRHVLVGYWHNFDNGSGFIRLRNVNSRWDVINIAFAVPVGTDGTLSFVPYTGTTVAEFKSDVAYLHSIGKKVVISIGGAEGQVSITDATKKTNFVNSLVSVINDYGFDGIDIDLEGSSVGLGNGDSNLQSPTSPGVTNLIAGIREIRNRFGANFMLTMAPETANVQGGYSVYGGPWGAYLPVLHATRDILTFVHVQHYNSGAMLGLDGRAYSQGTADFQVAMAEMLLQGFNAPSGSSNFFPPLRPDQVAIGLPSAPNAAGGGYTQPADIEKAVRYLAQGQSYGGSYTLRKPSGYADFRGLMSWSINWDAYNNYVFSTNSRNLLNSLP